MALKSMHAVYELHVQVLQHKIDVRNNSTTIDRSVLTEKATVIN
jgi:hypothetical protein